MNYHDRLQLAKIIIRDELRKKGEKLSHYRIDDVTAAARQLMNDESFPELIRKLNPTEK